MAVFPIPVHPQPGREPLVARVLPPEYNCAWCGFDVLPEIQDDLLHHNEFILVGKETRLRVFVYSECPECLGVIKATVEVSVDVRKVVSTANMEDPLDAPGVDPNDRC